MFVLLAHGAGAGQDHPWMHRVVRAFGEHEIEALTFNFPYIDAGRRTPDRAPVLEAHFANIWRDAVQARSGPCFAAGKSMGGRIASQVAAEDGFVPAAAGLIFFGYPLHPPNQPAKRRDAHLTHVTTPMLFVHGTRDPFGTADEMQALSASLPSSRLSLVTGGDHSLVATRRDDARGDSVERAVAVAAEWMRAIAIAT